MPESEKEIQEDNEFLESLLNPNNGSDDDENLSEEEKKAKEIERNRNAEEARKRREKEAKEKEESEKKAKEEAELKAKEEADKKAKEDAEKKAKEEAALKEKETKEKDTKVYDQQVESLGKQLSDFKVKYPDVELKALQNDEDFREYIEGKLLGKKDFTQIYEGFIAFKKRNNTDKDVDIEKNYMKQNSSTGSSAGSGYTPSDVYSESELESITKKLPFMHPSEAEKVLGKLERSVKHYEKK